MSIGVLALQGAFTEHIHTLDKLGVINCAIRHKDDLKHINGLIIPGGESTVIGKLLEDSGLMEPLRAAISNGLPVFGTCAGMILLSNALTEGEMSRIGAMDIEVARNAYGRQLGSFSTSGSFAGIGEIPMVFIRAPYITKAGASVDILSTVNGRIVAARQKHMLATAFHPELTDDLRIHQYFLHMVNKSVA